LLIYLTPFYPLQGEPFRVNPSPSKERGKSFERGLRPLSSYSPFPYQGKGVRGMGFEKPVHAAD
jgi:hypothetical protein